MDLITSGIVVARERPNDTDFLAVTNRYFYPERPDYIIMLIEMNEHDSRAVTKLYASYSDISFARMAASHLLKKGWHNRMPWSRGKVYFHQSVYVTSLVVAYGRVFEVGKSGYNFPRKLMAFDEAELELHKRLLALRNKVHAHSDLEKWSVRPWRARGSSTEIIGQPKHVIAEKDINLFLLMTEALLTRIAEKQAAILAKYKLSEDTEAPAKLEKVLEQLEVGESIFVPHKQS